MVIEAYKFGEIIIDWSRYTKDIILAPAGIHANWRRAEGHLLVFPDLADALAKNKPELLIIGTGKFGMMKISTEFIKHLKPEKIELIVERTGKAVNIFNDKSHTQKVMGAFHLTC